MRLTLEGAIASISGRLATVEKSLAERRLAVLGGLERHNCAALPGSPISNLARRQASQVNQRHAVELERSGASPTEIARQMQLSEGTIHRYLRQARRRG